MKTKFLRLVPSQAGGPPESGKNEGYLAFHLEKNSTFFSKEIGMEQFTFTEGDYHVLNSYTSCSTKYKHFGQKCLSHEHINAQRKRVNYLNVDIKDGVTAMVNKRSPYTVDEYGYRLGPFSSC